MRRPFLFVLACIAARALVSHAAEPLDTWTARNPLPTGNSLYGVTFGITIEGNTNFIAVGQSGTIMTSSQASNWVTRVSGTNCDLFGVAYGTNSFNGPQLVAVGTRSETGAGNILASPDGINWSSVNPVAINPLYAVTYGQDSAGAAQFVAVGGSGAILVSGDGTNWSARASGTTNALYGVAYGNVGGTPTFVTVGLHINADGTSSATFITSTDGGATWQPNILFPPGVFKCVAYATGGFVVASTFGDIYTSIDSLTWKARVSGTTTQLNGFAFGNGQIIAVGDAGVALTSLDGKIWSTNNTGVSGNLNAAAFGNGTFVIVGDNGLNLNSTDLSAWNIARFRVVTTDLDSVAYGNNNYVGVGGAQGSYGTVVTSTNGTYWVHLAGLTNTALFAVAFGINSFGNPLFVAAGNPLANDFSPSILISGDATNWSTLGPLGASGSPSGVTCGANESGPLFVVVGSFAGVLTSPDGTNWGKSATGQPRMNAVTYGNGHFVAVGTEASQVSSDGLNWTPGTGVSGVILGSVAYGNGLFVATGYGGAGQIYTSPDGTNWTPNLSLSSPGLLRGITFARGTFVVVGHLQGANGETAGLFTSTNGIDWVARNSGAYGNLVSVTYGDGDVSQFIAVGTSDLILGATHSVRIPLSYSRMTGAFLPIFNLPFGRVFTLHFSSDLINWSVLTNAAIGRAKPVLLINDPSATNHPNGFYSINIH